MPTRSASSTQADIDYVESKVADMYRNIRRVHAQYDSMIGKCDQLIHDANAQISRAQAQIARCDRRLAGRGLPAKLRVELTSERASRESVVAKTLVVKQRVLAERRALIAGRQALPAER